MEKRYGKGKCAGAYSAIEVVTGKWKPMILYHLGRSDFLRFNELKRLIPDITQKMLTSHLKELEQHLIIERKVYAEVPPRVEYALTEYGRSVIPLLDALQEWGLQHLQYVEAMK